jgi:cytochrome oxidase Cu insertion factor (SCO1/SenC/PrrC family)
MGKNKNTEDILKLYLRALKTIPNNSSDNDSNIAHGITTYDISADGRYTYVYNFVYSYYSSSNKKHKDKDKDK